MDLSLLQTNFTQPQALLQSSHPHGQRKTAVHPRHRRILFFSETEAQGAEDRPNSSKSNESAAEYFRAAIQHHFVFITFLLPAFLCAFSSFICGAFFRGGEGNLQYNRVLGPYATD
jgi:hypothetical protein